MNQFLIGNQIPSLIQTISREKQDSKSLIKDILKKKNSQVKVSTTLIEQSLIANMFQTFSVLYYSTFALGVLFKGKIHQKSSCIQVCNISLDPLHSQLASCIAVQLQIATRLQKTLFIALFVSIKQMGTSKFAHKIHQKLQFHVGQMPDL